MENATEGSRRDSALRRLVLVIGLGCFFSSVLIYSATVTPFQSFPGVSYVVGYFANASLTASFFLALAWCAASAFGVNVSGTAAIAVAGPCSILSGMAFAFGSLAGVPEAFAVPFGVGTGLACACGSIGLGVLWGRELSAFGLRPAMADVAFAALISLVIRFSMHTAPPALAAVIFCAASAASTALLLVARRWEGRPAQFALYDSKPDLASFASVAFVPAVGLTLFAFMMGVMRNVFVELFVPYLAAAFVACIVALLCTAVRWKASLARAVYGRALLLISVVSLACTNVLSAAFGIDGFNGYLTLVVFAFAAVLAIATIAAVAHAGEFPCDFVFSFVLAMFSGASIAGLITAEFIPNEYVYVVSVAITAVYAIAIALGQYGGGYEAHEPAGVDAMVAQARAGSEVYASCGRLPRAVAPVSGEEPCEAEGKRRGPVRASEASQEGPARTSRAAACALLVERYGLTKRESEILALLADGHGGAYISEVLFISPNTARTHIHNIYRKLGAASREDVLLAVKRAMG